jgi:hypothetical protein
MSFRHSVGSSAAGVLATEETRRDPPHEEDVPENQLSATMRLREERSSVRMRRESHGSKMYTGGLPLIASGGLPLIASGGLPLIASVQCSELVRMIVHF